MNEPMFSVVIPTYNRAGTIPRAIESCLAQTDQDFEIVVVDDDKSKDDMTAALAPYTSRCTILLKLDHHGKAASARNEGVRLARGRHIAFLDADDAWLPEKLATCRTHLEREPDALFYSRNYVDRGVGRYWIKPARGLTDDETIYDYLFADKGWVHPSTIVVATDTARAHPFREDLSFGDDTQFAVDLWKSGVKIRMIERELAIYHDPPQFDRLSQSPVFAKGKTPTHSSFMEWAESERANMSDTTWLAYRAFWRSRFVAPSSARQALGDIWSARRSVGTGRVLSQTVQTFFPRSYRRLADIVARFDGIDPATLRHGAADGASAPVHGEQVRTAELRPFPVSKRTTATSSARREDHRAA